MPSIATVNYTVMQGDTAREMQNIRSFAQDTAQPAVVQKQEKHNEEKKVTVQDFDQSKDIKLKKDGGGQNKNRGRHRTREETEAAKESGKEVLRAKKKRLLDIVI